MGCASNDLNGCSNVEITSNGQCRALNVDCAKEIAGLDDCSRTSGVANVENPVIIGRVAVWLTLV